MTARDDAIAGVLRVFAMEYPDAPAWERFVSDALDAIPPTVLVRLAIEQGALEELSLAAWWMQDTDPNQPLFRLVEP